MRMNAYIVSDGEYETDTLLRLDALVKRVLTEKGFAIAEKRLRPAELAWCRGCFGCWVKTPGECVIRDAMADINRANVQNDVMVYLTPIVFGQYSANIKSALDRWIPNALPFLVAHPNGGTTHPPRYAANAQYIMLGYGDGLTAEDKRLFSQITVKHRANGTVLIYEGDDERTEQELGAVHLQKVSRFL